jgi:hypothetical protein
LIADLRSASEDWRALLIASNASEEGKLSVLQVLVFSVFEVRVWYRVCQREEVGSGGSGYNVPFLRDMLTLDSL